MQQVELLQGIGEAHVKSAKNQAAGLVASHWACLEVINSKDMRQENLGEKKAISRESSCMDELFFQEGSEDGPIYHYCDGGSMTLRICQNLEE